MFTATKDIKLPTSIIGSLPRPNWYTENLGRRSFMEAMINARFREQYTDAVSCSCAIRSWPGSTSSLTATPITTPRSAAIAGSPTRWSGSAAWICSRPSCRRFQGRGPYQRGHILHEGMEARASVTITGPITRGHLQYTPIWVTAQRLTQEADQVRHHHAGAFGAGLRRRLLQGPARADHGVQRGPARGLAELADAAASPSRWRSRRSISWACAAPPISIFPSWSRSSTTRCAACAPRARSGAIPAGATRRSNACSPSPEL